MGEVRCRVVLQNLRDLHLKEARKLGRKRARSLEIDAVVDTGAVLMLLPQEIVEKLGVGIQDRVIVQLANDQKIELPRTESLQITIAGRDMATNCLVGPPGCEPLVGQIVLEQLDLIPDSAKRTLTPRPESPFLPTLKLKVAALA